MIISFACKETEKIWLGKQSRKFPADIQDRALVKLGWIDAANNAQDLRVPPSNNLETLKGDRKGQMSIRINKQWRICFEFHNGDAYEVEITDYH
ncbi:MAG: type II toxin-antitoxin system RelE/ParE family toxin [Alphaproteobacteria bacterium]|nr:type II toxin-antitoxin system RelE/ParE family toxin [Alphaproteobacteria bacterium]